MGDCKLSKKVYLCAILKIYSIILYKSMKRTINNFFMLIASAVLCCFFAACDPTAGKQDFSVVFKAAGPGYVTVEATVAEPIEVAYICKDTPLSTTDANIIFMTGKKTTFTASGEQQLLA